MAALAVPARLPGALHRRDIQDSLKTLVPGRRFLAFYGGADNVWHEQVAGWPASADGGTWAICTSDGDVYNQDMVGGTMATHVVVLPPDGTRPGGLVAGIYGFTRGLTAAEMLGAIRRCRIEAITNVASESVLPMPMHVVMCGGRTMTLAEAGLALPPGRRLGGKVSPAEAAKPPKPPAGPPPPGPALPLVPGGVPARDPLPGLGDGLAAATKPSGLWVVGEPAAGMQIGDPIIPGEVFRMYGADQAMAQLQLGPADSAWFFCRRVADDGGNLLEGTRTLMAEYVGSLRANDGLPVDDLKVHKEPDTPKADALAAAVKGFDDDMRTLEVTYDAQQVRHKDFRVAVTELVEDTLADCPLDDPTTTWWLGWMHISPGNGMLSPTGPGTSCGALPR